VAKVSARRRKELRKPDEFVTFTMKMGQWVRDNQRLVMFAGIAVVVIVVGVALSFQLMGRSRVRSSTALWQAVATASAPIIDPEETEEEIPARIQHFKTLDERNEAASKALEKVIKAQSDTSAGQVARLGLAGTKLAKGDYAGARSLYENFLKNQGGFDALKANAVEGLGYCLEGQKNYSGALERFRELEKLDDGAHADLAKYHQARMLEKLNKRDQAAELYRGIVRRAEQATDEMVTDLFVVDRAEDRLEIIDPGSDVLKARSKARQTELLKQILSSGGAGGAGLPNLPPPPPPGSEE
jgi:tetratricopeptide (TPR) repeat protein